MQSLRQNPNVYRDRFADFLGDEYPRIPFPAKKSHFEVLASLGHDLAQKHLLRDVPVLNLGTYRGKGSNEVVRPRYVETECAVYINDKQCFSSPVKKSD